MTNQTDQRQSWIEEATKLGREAGKAAASWATDGNTAPEHYARLVRMFDEGDPELSDHLPERPNLSGEWADDPSPIRLYELVTGNDHSDAEADAGLAYETLVGSVVDALSNAWEAGVDETFEAECERLIRAALPDDMTCGECGHTWNSYLTPTPAARCPNEYEHEDTSEDLATDHGFEVCPDCGDVGTKIGANGYEPCTRFRSCWSDA